MGIVNLLLTSGNFHPLRIRLLRDFMATDYDYESEKRHAAVQTIPGKERTLLPFFLKKAASGLTR